MGSSICSRESLSNHPTHKPSKFQSQRRSSIRSQGFPKNLDDVRQVDFIGKKEGEFLKCYTMGPEIEAGASGKFYQVVKKSSK